MYTIFCLSIHLWWTLRLLLPFGCCKHCCYEHDYTNTCSRPCCQFFWLECLEVELLDNMVILFNFLKNCQAGFHSSCTIYIPTSIHKGSNFITYSPTLISFFLPSSFSPSRLSFLTCSVQLLSSVRLFATPWTAARQASLSITNSHSLLKLMSIELVMPSKHLILCHPLHVIVP